MGVGFSNNSLIRPTFSEFVLAWDNPWDPNTLNRKICSPQLES